MSKILLVEDDEDLATVVSEHLSSERFDVDHVKNGRDALEVLRVSTFDLIILDWNLPHVSGLDVCAEFRRGGGMTPIIMLTGKKAIEEKEAGLDTGADDYLTKPFSLRELSARVRAGLRRPDKMLGAVLRVRDIEMDTDRYAVQKGGETLHLQPQEFALLEFFLKHPDQVFSPEALL
ncbi:MAG: response regulator transcription factor, partial [Terriglobales bacterium]